MQLDKLQEALDKYLTGVEGVRLAILRQEPNGFTLTVALMPGTETGETAKWKGQARQLLLSISPAGTHHLNVLDGDTAAYYEAGAPVDNRDKDK